jgi:hypothetical protein
LRPRKSLQSGLQRMRSLTVRFCCTCVPWYCFAMPAAVLKVRGCNAASRSVDVILAVLRVREIASQLGPPMARALRSAHGWIGRN